LALLLNFHNTFLPERRLLHALMEYIAQGKSGSTAEVARETGIPTGRSSGKLPAIIQYALGMGLIQKESPSGAQKNRYTLTDFGRSVYLNDPMLSEPFTQWMVHFHLCLPDDGAKAWNLVFGQGSSILGSRFTRAEVENYLVREFGPGRQRTGPLLRTYLRDEALGRAGILEVEGDFVRRKTAPIQKAYAAGYAAFATMLMEKFFGHAAQVALNDFQENTRWFDICLWSPEDVASALSLMEETGWLAIDRQMRPYILERKMDSSSLWPQIYDHLQ